MHAENDLTTKDSHSAHEIRYTPSRDWPHVNVGSSASTTLIGLFLCAERKSLSGHSTMAASSGENTETGA
jgi:hypothetical protein